jgi:ABC-2 type transport system ATP-binding protein
LSDQSAHAAHRAEDAAITLDGIAKTYVVRARRGRLRRTRRAVRAVDGVSFTVQSGEMVGYLGPNGAGKSTTIKMITGILTPSAGSIRVLGFEPTRQRTALTRRIGVVFGQRSQLWWDLPLADSFELLHHVYRTDADRHRHNLAAFVDRLDLKDFLDVPVRQLSLGQRMRGDLTAALLHDPALVVLDEPTMGLDVVSKYAVRQFLKEVNAERGTTVLLTTHDLDDVEQLCRRMLIIDNGRVLLDDEVASFKARHGTERTLIVDLAMDGEASLQLGTATVAAVDGPRHWVRFDRRQTTAAQVIAEISATHSIVDLSLSEPDIEELIHRVYEARRGDGEAPSDGSVSDRSSKR